MTHLVEGDWNGFIFKMLTIEHLPALSDHIRNNFFIDEPIMKTIFGLETDLESNIIIDDISPDEIADANEFNLIIQNCIEENLSFAAYDKKTGKMAGVRLLSHCKKQDEKFSTRGNYKSLRGKIIVEFIKKVDATVDIYKIFNVEEYAELRMASVDREYRHVGLATEMYKRGFKFLQDVCGLTVIKGIFTSPYTRAAATNFQFQELARRYINEIEDLDGRLLLPDFPETEFVSVMAVQLPTVNFMSRL